MRYERLPSTLNKKDEAGNPLPNTVKVTNNVRLKSEYEGKKDENGKPLDVPPVELVISAESFEFIQYENFDEFTAECGGLDAALEIVNDLKRNAATAAGKNAIRMATLGTEDEMIASGLRICKNHSFKQEATISTKDKAARFDELSQLLSSGDGQISQEELMRRVLELAKVS